MCVYRSYKFWKDSCRHFVWCFIHHYVCSVWERFSNIPETLKHTLQSLKNIFKNTWMYGHIHNNHSPSKGQRCGYISHKRFNFAKIMILYNNIRNAITNVYIEHVYIEHIYVYYLHKEPLIQVKYIFLVWKYTDTYKYFPIVNQLYFKNILIQQDYATALCGRLSCYVVTTSSWDYVFRVSTQWFYTPEFNSQSR